jgi:hypothetical protein
MSVHRSRAGLIVSHASTLEDVDDVLVTPRRSPGSGAAHLGPSSQTLIGGRR